MRSEGNCSGAFERRARNETGSLPVLWNLVMLCVPNEQSQLSAHLGKHPLSQQEVQGRSKWEFENKNPRDKCSGNRGRRQTSVKHADRLTTCTNVSTEKTWRKIQTEEGAVQGDVGEERLGSAPNGVKDINVQIHEGHPSPRRINPRKAVSRHIITTQLKASPRGKHLRHGHKRHVTEEAGLGQWFE